MKIVSDTKDNGVLKAIEMSRDHSGDDPIEMARLRKEHPDEPDVVRKGRVKGYLQPTRGIGDGVYKRAIFNEIVRKRSSSDTTLTAFYFKRLASSLYNSRTRSSNTNTHSKGRICSYGH
jgi:pyruvate dehydrogenase phosphatase